MNSSIAETEPLVSIVMPTYNRLNLLLKSINSVLNQSYENWELIIVDDGSTDGTMEKMAELEAEEPRIRYMRIPRMKDSGISGYLNYGISMSEGKYIARIDDDDYWYNKEKLSLQVGFMESNPEYVVVGGGCIIVDESGIEVFKYFKNETDEEIRNFALFANPMTHTSVLFRKDTFEKAGGYENLDHAEDMDLFLRLGKYGKLFNMKEYFVAYLSVGQNKSFLFQRENSKAVLDIIKRHKDHYPHFMKAYMLNFTQYAYSFLPMSFRKIFQPALYYLKRKHF